MPKIKGFKGVIYNPKIIDDFKNVVAPPYDVISQEQRDAFYQMNPINVIRLILPKEEKGDTASNNKYTRAKKQLDAWLKDRTLVEDKKDAIYIYTMTYSDKGKKKTRVGFFSLMEATDFSKKIVLPHEKTHAGPKIDRMKLIKQVKSNLSPVFCLYEEKENKITDILNGVMKSQKPMIDVTIDNVTHRFWPLHCKKRIAIIQKIMKDKKVVIADGHHRYTVACNYKELMSKKPGYKGEADHAMTFFTNLDEPANVCVWPTHRLIKTKKDVSLETLKNKLGDIFDVKKYKSLSDLIKVMQKDKKINFGIHVKNGFLHISLKKEADLDSLITENRSKQWKRLDVAVLHSLVINKLLCLKLTEANVKYVKQAKEVLEDIRSGKYTIAFLMNPTKPKQVLEVAEQGDVMPQKSTYFYPKLLTGLVINKMG